jgi:glycosyltransferase involved in cell wall biosynthesis
MRWGDTPSSNVMDWSEGNRSISIVLPCFNEARLLHTSLASLTSRFPGTETEFLVVDDGSEDGTCDIGRGFAQGDSRVRVYRLETNQGKGAAVVAAAKVVRGDLVAVIDADLSCDHASLVRALATLEQADLVIGNRRNPASRYGVPVHLFGFLYRRHLLGGLFNLFVRLLLPVDWLDTQCGLKTFRREAFQRVMAAVRTSGFAFDIELLVLAKALGLRVADVPVYVMFESSRTSVRLLRDGAQMLRDVLMIAGHRWRGGYRPEKLPRPAFPAESAASMSICTGPITHRKGCAESASKPPDDVR